MIRTLIYTLRDVEGLVAYSHLYEFEDIASELLEADVIRLSHYNELDLYRKIYKAVKRTTGRRKIAEPLARRAMSSSLAQPVTESYDLFLSTFNHIYETFTLLALGNWRAACQKAACYIIELWEHDFPECEYLLDFLKDFDHIFLATRQCVKRVAELTGKPCTYLPLSVDTLRFHPNFFNIQPTIEYCNVGRRSPITHQALLNHAETRRKFYYYDTFTVSNVINASKQQTFYVKNAKEHRNLLANVLKHSRYYIANRARANEFRQNQSELSSRFFEGAAAGTVMLGEPPDTDDFKTNFDWTDAVISIPFDCPEIVDIVNDLDVQQERLEAIRRTNVAQALLRHDSVYRLKSILEQVGLEPTPKMVQRETELRQMARKAYEN